MATKTKTNLKRGLLTLVTLGSLFLFSCTKSSSGGGGNERNFNGFFISTDR